MTFHKIFYNIFSTIEHCDDNYPIVVNFIELILKIVLYFYEIQGVKPNAIIMKNLFIISTLLCVSISVNAQNSIDQQDTFQKVRDLFLSGLENKKISDLNTVVGDSVIMIFPDGELMKGKKRFMEFNEAWFKKKWDIKTEIVSTDLQDNIGYSLIRYKYQRYKIDGTSGQLSDIYLVVILKKVADKWFVIHNQHTKKLI